MIIGIPVIEKEVDGKRIISPHFGRAPMFVVYNDITGETLIVSNPKSKTGCGGGAGRFIFDTFMRNGVDIVLIKGIGEGAFYNLQKAGMKAYLVSSDIKFVDDAVSAFKTGKFMEVTEPIENEHH